MAESFKYDVFLSHSSKDKAAVRELAERLRRDGLRIWFDEWEIQPGDPILLKIEEGLEQSRALLLAMSRNAFASEWVALERHTAMFRDPTNQRRRFIPLRLDDAEIKDALKQFAYVDWRQRDDKEYARLLGACWSLESALPQAIKRRSESLPYKVLEGHKDKVWCVAVTSDGRRAVSGSSDNTVRVWELDSGKGLATLKGHTDAVWGVAVMADGQQAVSCSKDKTVRVWELDSGKCLAVLEGHTDAVNGVAVTPDGRRVVSGSLDKTVRVWELDSGKCLATLEGHTSMVNGVAVTLDGRQAVSGSKDKTVRVWELDSGRCLATLEGHTGWVKGVAVTPDGRWAVSGSLDDTVRVWDLDSGKCLATLEGHTSWVWGVAVTPDGRRAVSGSLDNTVRVWDLDSGKCLATLKGHTDAVWGVAVTPDGRRVVSGSDDKMIRVWELPPESKESAAEFVATRYTNAKVLLVGDSGVGKSGLALRLIEDRFEPTISTDALWATQMKLPHDVTAGDTEREIWLWDFGGQADYRLIHQLYMDETALAALVFNPQSENPFEGLGQWDRDLGRAAHRSFKRLLVAGRCDRGGLMVSRESIERFIAERRFAGYLETSAYTGDGCRELREAIIKHIPWDDIPWTASPRIFKLLKEEIVKLKDEGKVLLRMSELKQQLEMRMPGESFTLAELRAVVGLLIGPGVVWQLEFGDFVLLQPERVNAYAAAVIRTVRAHTDEIGSIFEDNALAGELDYQDMKRLPPDEEQIVLRAMHQTFVDHSLCLREHTEKGTLLVFPSYFKRERPELGEHPTAFITYSFSGMLDEIYATLVVRLHHTAAFERNQLWRFAADFKTVAGKRVGLMMTKKPEGAAEITVYFESGISGETMVTFIRYVHDHLTAKGEFVVRTRHYACSKCNTPVANHEAVRRRLAEGKKDIYCVYCEERVLLWDLIEEKFASEQMQQQVRAMKRHALDRIETQSRELILIGHAFSVARETGQRFNQFSHTGWGVDGEIEFTNDQGEPSGKRVYLQFKSDEYFAPSEKGGQQVFTIVKEDYAEQWRASVHPVMLVVRDGDGRIFWMNVTEYLKQHGKAVKQVVFDGEPFTAQSVWRMRDRLFR